MHGLIENMPGPAKLIREVGRSRKLSKIRKEGAIMALIILLAAITAAGQSQQGITSAPRDSRGGPAQANGEIAKLNYVLGAGDEIVLSVPDMPEIGSEPIRIDFDGQISVPMLGQVDAVGRTVVELQAVLRERLKKFVLKPQVEISISEFRSQPILVLGAVASPGVHQLEGTRTLYEVLSLAGGLAPDAGNTINITREYKWGGIPLDNAKIDPSGQFSVAYVKVKDIMDATIPAENVLIKPNDVITVPKVHAIYVVGLVKKPGGFPIGQQDSLSALQALSLSGGLDKNAAPSKAKILRNIAGSPARSEIAVNLKQLMAGKGSDVALKADDILFVPDSAAKSITSRSLDAIISLAVGMTIYGRY